MEDGYQIQLGSRDIVILAALLGYESVFGVEENTFSDADTDMKSWIRQQVRRLERKKLIRYDLDGTLYMVPGLRQAIDCMGSAETVGVFSTNLRSGKKASVYILEKASKAATLERLNDGKFRIRLTESIPLKEIIPYEILSSRQTEMKERMLFEEAEYVHKQIEAFNHDEAETRLKKHIRNESAANMIAKILTGNCGYMSVQIYRKGKALYEALYHTLLMAVDNYTISLIADENGVLCFEALSPVKVVEQISSQFRLSEKRGAV